jgi:hypothetical protein
MAPRGADSTLRIGSLPSRVGDTLFGPVTSFTACIGGLLHLELDIEISFLVLSLCLFSFENLTELSELLWTLIEVEAAARFRQKSPNRYGFGRR